MSGLVDDSDTIAAIATGPGAGGIGVVRLSGRDAFAIARDLTRAAPAARVARFVRIRDAHGAILDEGILLRFPGPQSFTGEDIAELQCHGGPVLLRSILRECLRRGARQAEPGEFSQRAFLNGKIDLVQAEAIADLISSSTEAAARSASRSLTGSFSRQIEALFEQLVGLRVYVEAAIDFPEEEIDFIADSDVLQRLDALVKSLEELLLTAQRGRRLHDGLKLVIAGAPNAGKSSLLNRLAEYDSAIVTDVPGTTRDVLREHVQIDGIPLHLVDTAGLRATGDAVEQEGIRRARLEMHSADRILLVIDNSEPAETPKLAELLAVFADDLPEGVPVTVLWNKCDLNGMPAAMSERADCTQIHLSAATGEGMDLLRQHLLQVAGFSDGEGSEFSARERHIAALRDCAEYLRQGRMQLMEHGAAELVAEDLRLAQERLGSITGRFSSDALLGEIFSSFCIGK